MSFSGPVYPLFVPGDNVRFASLSRYGGRSFLLPLSNALGEWKLLVGSCKFDVDSVSACLRVSKSLSERCSVQKSMSMFISVWLLVFQACVKVGYCT
jgi:hypothetical protein